MDKEKGSETDENADPRAEEERQVDNPPWIILIHIPPICKTSGNSWEDTSRGWKPKIDTSLLRL